jgi:hypothetical protein
MLEIVRNYAVDGVHFRLHSLSRRRSLLLRRMPGAFRSGAGTDGCRMAGRCAQTRRCARALARFQAVEHQRRGAARFGGGPQDSARRADFGRRVRNWPSDRDGVGQDWKLWCDNGWLDFVCPMDYIDSTGSSATWSLHRKPTPGACRLIPASAFVLEGSARCRQARPADCDCPRIGPEGFHGVQLRRQCRIRLTLPALGDHLCRLKGFCALPDLRICGCFFAQKRIVLGGTAGYTPSDW